MFSLSLSLSIVDWLFMFAVAFNNFEGVWRLSQFWFNCSLIDEMLNEL